VARFTNYPLQQAIVLTDHSTDVQSGDEVGILLSLGTELLATAISERLGERNTASIVVTAPERVRQVTCSLGRRARWTEQFDNPYVTGVTHV